MNKDNPTRKPMSVSPAISKSKQDGASKSSNPLWSGATIAPLLGNAVTQTRFVYTTPSNFRRKLAHLGLDRQFLSRKSASPSPKSEGITDEIQRLLDRMHAILKKKPLDRPRLHQQILNLQNLLRKNQKNRVNEDRSW